MTKKKKPSKTASAKKKLTIADLKKVKGGYMPVDCEEGSSEFGSRETDAPAGGKESGYKESGGKG